MNSPVPFAIIIPSHKRADVIKRMLISASTNDLEYSPLKIICSVQNSDFNDYHKMISEVPLEFDIEIMASGSKNKAEQVNVAFDHIKSKYDVSFVVSMDDDFQYYEYYKGTQKYTSFLHLSELLVASFNQANGTRNLGGFSTNKNKHWASQSLPLSYTGMLLGMCMIQRVDARDQLFDPNLNVLEDLDAVIRAHVLDGGIMRINDYIIHFHFNAPKNKKLDGGQVNQKKIFQDDSIRYILNKWKSPYLDIPLGLNPGIGLTRKIKWKKLAGVK